MRGQIIKRGDCRYLVRAPRGRDVTGKRLYHNRTIHGTKKVAQEYLSKVLREMDLGAFVERSKESVTDYLVRWLDDTASKKVRARTLEDYRALARKHLIPSLGNHALGQLTTEVIERTYSQMTEAGLSPRTVGYAHSVLHNALAHAVARGHLARNPAAGATLPRLKQREMRSLTPEEASRLLGAARGTRFEALWNLLLTAGLRPGEALGLKWADIDGDRTRIQRSLVHLTDGSWHFDAPKTDKARRSIPLPPSTLAALREHRAKQNAVRLEAGSTWHHDDLVFCTGEGQPLEWRVVARRYFRPLIKSAGLPHMRPYDLRHSCATLLLASGENAKVVSERLGHAKVALTLDVYSHVLPDMQQGAADKLESLLFRREA